MGEVEANQQLRLDGRPHVAPSGAGWAWLAAGLALASMALSVYWTSGGTFLLDTVGGDIEALARERDAGALALGGGAAAVKGVAAALAIAIGCQLARPPVRRAVVGLNALAAAVLILWGGANVVVGALVLLDAVDPGGAVDERALRWHVLFWDLWFLLWGVALALAARASRRTAPDQAAASC